MTDHPLCRLRALAWTIVAVALAALPCAAGAAPAGGNGDAPQATTATYHDWVVRCAAAGRKGAASAKICEIEQLVPAPNRRGVAARIVIGHPAADKPEHMIVQLPVGVWLPDGVALHISRGASITASFKQCIKLCFADTDVDDNALKALRGDARLAHLVFTDAARHSVSLRVSLRGLSEALDAASTPAP